MKLTIEITARAETRGPAGEAACHHQPITNSLRDVIDALDIQGAMVEGQSAALRDHTGRLCGRWTVTA